MTNLVSKVAYFSKEFAIDQSLKIYSGGLGFLAGSYLKSAYALNKDLIGVGILWKYGYYDQDRDEDGLMKVNFEARHYHFLEDTGVQFTVNVHDKEVWVKVWLLKPETFETAPLYLLSTDVPENDFLSQTITHHLYDKNEATRVAQSILLGIGGAKMIDVLGLAITTYHLNEASAVPLIFYLYSKCQSISAVKQQVVFTTHTPEVAGNELRPIDLLTEMRFFDGLSPDVAIQITGQTGDQFDYTLGALRLARKANAVSTIHGHISREMWKDKAGVCDIIAITNAQNQKYWQDKGLKIALDNHDLQALKARKRALKQELFAEVADQTGKIFDPEVLTIVWARRFAGYKRAGMLLNDFEQFSAMVTQTAMPVQFIWAGKPYPFDTIQIALFHQIQQKTAAFANVAVLTGYELALSAKLKKGADVWLNTPRFTREASGTSGMSAAMNAAINFSIPDGWVAEFAVHGHNAFIIPVAETLMHDADLQEKEECTAIYKILQEEILPCYYKHHDDWLGIVENSMNEVSPKFDSNRMVEEYYKQLYSFS
ncbi:MAG: alpha-glucan family phosphorylase [Bacteroidota bacterium]|jgi:starch phosphorylase